MVDEYEDEVGRIVYEKLTKSKIRLPYPKVSFTFFKNKIYDGEKSSDFFYGFLKGVRSS